jgi:hypothetical protein
MIFTLMAYIYVYAYFYMHAFMLRGYNHTFTKYGR